MVDVQDLNVKPPPPPPTTGLGSPWWSSVNQQHMDVSRKNTEETNKGSHFYMQEFEACQEITCFAFACVKISGWEAVVIISDTHTCFKIRLKTQKTSHLCTEKHVKVVFKFIMNIFSLAKRKKKASLQIIMYAVFASKHRALSALLYEPRTVLVFCL